MCLPRPSGSGVLDPATHSTPLNCLRGGAEHQSSSLTTYHQLQHRCQTYIARHSDCAPYHIVFSSVRIERGTASDWTGEQGGTVTFIAPRALRHSRHLLHWEALWDSHSLTAEAQLEIWMLRRSVRTKGQHCNTDRSERPFLWSRGG